ncbi:hypothetical protein BC827DRAFT_1267541 [Russula dissimulans]|nr:hypothetical protein BC827DRAFT_1267541 [Russula dissimulans]
MEPDRLGGSTADAFCEDPSSSSRPHRHGDPTKDPVPPPNRRNENGGPTQSWSSSSNAGIIYSTPILPFPHPCKCLLVYEHVEWGRPAKAAKHLSFKQALRRLAHISKAERSHKRISSMVLGKDLGVGQESDNGPQCPRTPPTMLHPTLSSWLENMNKLKDLIDRLQELASAAPSDHRPQLQRQVAMLRATFKKQQERCIEFLRLSEEYANRYLLDISAEIQQQSSFLEMLEKRLDMAKTLHGQAVHLRKSYESRTVDAMKNVCETALSQPLPEDFDLFREVHFVLGEIKRCYTELDKFWTEEISRAIKALKTRRVDPDDVEQWRGFKTSLEQTVESWKGVDLGTIASLLSPSLGKLEETLQRVRESASVTFSLMSLGPVLQAKLGLTQNSELCLSFLRRCVDFGEIVAGLSGASITYPAFSRLRASNDLQERVMNLMAEPEVVDLSAENDGRSQGARKFSSVYKQSLSLQRKATLGLNTLLESVSSWMVFGDGLPNAPPGGFSLGLLRNLADAWDKGRASMRMVLAELTNDPAERLRYRTLSLNPRRYQQSCPWLMRPKWTI